MSRFGLLIAGLLIGAALPVQAAVNSQLRRFVGSPFRSSLINFVGGLLVLTIIVLLTASDTPVLRQSSWWMWFGGLFGAIYVTGTILLTPRIGPSSLFVMTVSGQLIMALLIDHFGLLNNRVMPITPIRLAGVALLVAGAILINRR